MKTEYLSSFIKDLKKLKKTSVYSEIKNLAFQTIPNCQNITEIKSLKKIKGHQNAYRIRVGDYRIGIFIQKETITFARVLHRRDVYRYFP
ncbi:type II toxin-antitoxin system RelE/ParE family toxin [Pleurocapsa sp. PCC 7319]|uniref:type II toxin-antitoxin system RelE family toxin n=1 Tax=Pleurocapsa sp. PCC 7319 TaxID=118161 RepID=UPI0003457B5B|nr:type II toxin-antitoxin system RelE/ParE family toxin [Pleurocapsa sp. PCC 7319]